MGKRDVCMGKSMELLVRDAEAAGSNSVASSNEKPVKIRLVAKVKHSVKECFSYL